jgi:hypothetical protein
MGINLNEDRQWLVTPTLNVGQVNANSTSEQTFTVKGLRVTDFVELNKPTHTSGIAIGNCRVSAADTLAVTFQNITGGNITPGSEVYQLWVERPEKSYLSVPLER